MKVTDGTGVLKIQHLEGLGHGAGTELVKAAIRESITRGFNGQVVLRSAGQAMGFYEKLGFVLTDPTANEFFLSTEAALRLLE